MNNNTNKDLLSVPQSQSLLVEEDALIDFSDEKKEVFMEVIEAALEIKTRTQFFRWTQSVFQYLIGHDVLIYSSKVAANQYQYSFLTSSRYFTQEILDEISAENGLLNSIIKRWQKAQRPLIVSSVQEDTDHQHYSVMHCDESVIAQTELKELIMHGFAKESSLVFFARLHQSPNTGVANALHLLMPYLHNVISNVINEGGNSVDENVLSYKRLSKREAEIIKWVYHSKSNREISEILTISPLTVKNHVQNIIKKLRVQNRRQAAIKALKLGLIETN